MKNTSDYCVYIGRFQPLTTAHLETISIALQNAEQCILLIGSSNASISVRNPFTVNERKEIISAALEDEGIADRVIVDSVPDSAYNFTAWTAKIQEIVGSLTEPDSSFRIIGHIKDDSSYYLKHFPMWELVHVPILQNNLSATEIRNCFFSESADFSSYYNTGSAIPDVITGIMMREKERFLNLKEEYDFLEHYREQWSKAPYPPVFVTTDAVVLYMAHILLIRRKLNPGKGKLALPGGFLDQNDTIFESCLRELREETKLDIPYPILKSSLSNQHVFDHPRRDPRGRTITHAFLFELDYGKDFPKVKAADDAKDVMWLPLAELDDQACDFFNDHYSIIRYFLGRSI